MAVVQRSEKRALAGGAVLKMIVFVLAASCSLAGCGIFTQSGGDRTLLNYFGDSKVTGARYYFRGEDGEYLTEELPADRLDELIDTIGSMDFRTYTFHTDYFWGGRFGIEFDLEDGKFLTYDGTRLSLRSASRASGEGSDIRSTFAEVKDLNFMEEMGRFFEAAGEAGAW